MAPRSGGISGLGVFIVGLGGWLIYAGIRQVPMLDGLRHLARGEIPTGTPPATTDVPGAIQFTEISGAISGGHPSSVTGTISAAASPVGAQIAAEARRHEGVPYRWGGTTPAGWDCSGFVLYVLRAVGVPVSGRPTAAVFLVWGGAYNVPRGLCAAGDLVCYGGHIGIALDGGTMIHAPTVGDRTKIAPIYGAPAIRRVKGSEPSPAIRRVS